MNHSSDTSQQTIPGCALGLTSADLSAWRDEAFAVGEMTRIGAHSAGCLACQERLQGFEAVAATLRTQQAPTPDERLWRSVLAALSADQTTTSSGSITNEITLADESSPKNPISPSSRPHSRRGRALGTLAAVAAIALVVVGFGQLFRSGAQNRPSQSFSVTWRQVTLPGGMGTRLDEGAALSVFPADGSIAWLCQSGTKPTPGPLRVWRTSDDGATWQALPVAQIDKAFDCEITPDQLNPDVVALNYGYIPPKAITIQGDNVITFDGGATWHNAPFFLLTREFATINGAIYAIRSDDSNINHLMVSRDGAQTWNNLDDSIHAQKLAPTQFWVNPNTSALLVRAVSLAGDGATSLWTVDANRNDWLQLGGSAPRGSNIVASPTADGSGWNACVLEPGVVGPTESAAYHNAVTCGPDARGAWTIRPGLDFPRWPVGKIPTPCNGCDQAQNSDLFGAFTLLGIANDGALLATAEDRFGAQGQAKRTSLYRLLAGSRAWQNGGALPIRASTFDAARLGNTVIYAPRPGGGMLWAMPDQDPGTHPAGSVFTASYPGPTAPPLPTPPQQTPTPTGNVDQGTPLAWQPITSPNSFQPRLMSTNILTVAPSDGRTAYACAQPNADPPATQLRGWVTRDGGVSWSTLALPQITGWCSLIVDEVNPRDVLLGVSKDPPAGGPPLPDRYYRSTDGGATWQHAPGLDGSLIYQFASYRGAVYALRNTAPTSIGDVTHLQVSTDGMVGWRTVDGAFFSPATSAAQFWLNPYNGTLLASNIPAPVNGIPMSSATTALIWRSSDDGAQWRSLGTPQLSAGGTSNVVVQPPQPDHTWSVCVSDFTASPTTAPSNLLYCSDDSGQNWHDMTALDTGDATSMAHFTAVTSDGALLAISATTTGSGATTYNVYRLPSGANRWQALGPTPEFSLLYAPAAGGDGLLWSVPVNGIISDAQGRVFTASAP